MSDATQPLVSGQPEPLRPPSLPAQLMRASDSDRDEVARALANALAEGRLTPEEHDDRLGRALNAKTLGELVPLTHDLVSVSPEAAAPWVADAVGSGRRQAIVLALFGGTRREGHWRVPARMLNLAVFGLTHLDLRSAVLESPTTDISVVCLYGGTKIVLPPGVRVVNNVVALFGGAKVAESAVAGSNAPTVRINGLCLFGGVTVEIAPAGDATGAYEFR